MGYQSTHHPAGIPETESSQQSTTRAVAQLRLKPHTIEHFELGDMALRLGRLKKECSQLQQSPPTGISCWPEGDDLTHFSAVIFGDEDTVYAGGIFKLEVEVPERYPFHPPKVRFLTKIYHPNIDLAGRVCLDLLKLPPSGSWRPIDNLSSILTSIRLLMATPNPNDPLMTDIAEEYQFKRSQYEATAKEWTQQHAKTEIQIGKSSDVGTSGTSSSSNGKRQLESDIEEASVLPEIDKPSSNKKIKT
ncbi:Ubiquitin-conjugating enzyme E2 T [Halocaridina rubra]|uniref:Ubiquitin-conjugating enzyme E2 T n=1 Tax=Halocaridina rubra TaxID=373956 RepID=A0AAN8WBV9_HALRR